VNLDIFQTQTNNVHNSMIEMQNHSENVEIFVLVQKKTYQLKIINKVLFSLNLMNIVHIQELEFNKKEN